MGIQKYRFGSFADGVVKRDPIGNRMINNKLKQLIPQQ
nr:MAG TPA: hypothetical protein [Caudoviricetes sp.]